MIARLFQHVAKFVSLVRTPHALKAFLTWRPFSFASYKLSQGLADLDITFRTIIDGGANIGQFARAVAETFPEAAVYSFEPLPDIAERCSANLKDKPLVKVFASALGSEEGSSTFYRNKFSQASSFLKLEPTATSDHELVSTKHTECTVPVTTLDGWSKTVAIQQPILLKLDLQGYELEALKGATELLSQIEFILVEVAIRKAYTGEPDLTTISAFMESHNFKVVGELNRVEGKEEQLLQVDALYRNTLLTHGK